MDTSYLERQRDNYLSQAAQAERAAAQYESLATGTSSQLTHKQSQLAIARAAKQACAVVKSLESESRHDLWLYGTRLNEALDTTSFSTQAGVLSKNDEGDAEDALSAATRLVGVLENECSSLISQLQGYRNQANAQRARANSARSYAVATQAAINNAR